MPDIYETLIGAAPTDSEQQAKIAEMLRRRRSFGELGALTGDRVLQPFGQNMNKQADAYAEQIQDTRLKDVDNAQTAKYQSGQLDHMGNALAETSRNNDLEHQDRQAAIRAQLEAAGIKAAAKGATPRKMTDNTRNSILATVDTYTGASNLLSTFKDDYVQKLGAGPQSRLPNTMSRMGLGTEGMDDAANWWAGWNEIRTLPERNRLFGATLTPNEKAEWDKVDINPSMKAEQIRKGVARIQAILLRHATNRARGMISEGYDPDAINTYYQDMFGEIPAEEAQVTDERHGAIDRSGGAPAPKRIKVDAEGNEIGN
jgi:hypothetical protein